MGLVITDPLVTAVLKDEISIQALAVLDNESPIPIHTQEYVCTDGSSSNFIDSSKAIDGTIYRILSMQDDMKTLSYPDRVRTEFDLFLQYAEEKTSGKPIPNGFNDFDEYLGKVGTEYGNIC